MARWRDVWFLPGAANAAAPRGVVYFEGVSRSREADAAASLRCEVRQERWKSDVSSFEVEQKLGGMGIGKEKSWRKEYKRQGDQTKISTKRKAADVTLPTDVQG